MKKTIQFLAVLFLFNVLFNSSAYSVNEFRSVVSGSWNSNSTWHMFNGSLWVPATSTPNDGSGTITIQNPHIVTVTANVTADQLIVDAGGTLTINSGIVLTVLNGGNDDISLLPGANINGPGTVQTQGTTVVMNLREGSNFNAALKVNSGITSATDIIFPYNGRLFGPVTVDLGATLTMGTGGYFLEVFGDVTNNGTIAGTSGGTFALRGPSLANNGIISATNFRMDTTSTITGSGTFISSVISITDGGNISLLSNVTFSPGSTFIVNTAGILNPNNQTLTLTSGKFNLLSGATVTNSGTFQTQGTVTLNLKGGSAFNAPLKVNSGITTGHDESFPYVGKLFGPLTVDNGATLTTSSGGYSIEVFGAVTNNGTIAGTSGGTFALRGPSLINNNSITVANFRMDTTSTIAGSGMFTSSAISITDGGNISLLNNVTFSPASTFTVNTVGILNPNNQTLTLTSGEFNLMSGATVTNSGTFQTQGTVTLDLKGGSAFNAPLKVNSGITTGHDETFPYVGKLFGLLTVDNGATLTTSSGGYSIEVYGAVTNNGTIAGTSGGTFRLFGASLVNNGIISINNFGFQTGVHTLQGTGIWTTTALLLNGATVNLTSSHQFLNVVINAGATFNTGSNTVKFTASNPIIQNGTYNNVNSKIEYNGTVQQNISAVNITYYGLRINNPSGTVLLANVSVIDTLSVIQGDLDLAGKIITISSIGYLTETAGNTVKGSTGYITTTRNVGTPNLLNVGGFGAVLSATSDLGNTEIRRGHGVQTGGSIRRYFDITPANNSGLNATLKFKYDDSELNLRPEQVLKLVKSTNAGISWTLMGGTVNTSTNEITLSGLTSFSRWTADSSGISAVVSMIIEGFYNASTNRLSMLDTVRAYLRSVTFPYGIVDSSKAILDSVTLKAAFVFTNAPNGTYYIQIKHRNSIETWSKPGGESYSTTNTLNYDFTSDASKAFGNNMRQVDTSPVRFGIYSGDVNQDGIVDASDLSDVDNDAFNSVSGYVNTDVNGDDFVDASDLSVVDNNAFLGVFVITP